MFNQQGWAEVAQPMDLKLLEVIAELDSGNTGKPPCQVFNFLGTQRAEFGKDTMFDLAVFTIRLGKSVISVGLAVRLLHSLSLEIHSACILTYSRRLSREGPMHA